MSNSEFTNKIELSIADKNDWQQITDICKALSSPDKVAVFALICENPRYLSEIAKKLDYPITTVSRIIDLLEASKLITVDYQPSKKGHLKYCSKRLSFIDIVGNDPVFRENAFATYNIEMPISLYSGCDIQPPCGMAGSELDLVERNPSLFYSPKRLSAELIWFKSGFLTYFFPLPDNNCNTFKSISFSLELCSEANYFNPVWPSDITFYINDKEIATACVAGDYGGRKGKYSPDYWSVQSTQYGELWTLTVNNNGVFLNNVNQNSGINIKSLNFCGNKYVKFDVGVKENAVHCGGINIFGKQFGDFPQGIVMELCYSNQSL